MKIRTITAILLMALFAMSCNNSANQQDIAIELNDGQKWKVNAEMTPHILGGEKILNEYDNSDYKALAKQLKDKNNTLIKSCTMNGASHDELHKWLHPHMGLVKALGKAKDEEKANSIIEQLKKSFITFNTYFE